MEFSARKKLFNNLMSSSTSSSIEIINKEYDKLRTSMLSTDIYEDLLDDISLLEILLPKVIPQFAKDFDAVFQGIISTSLVIKNEYNKFETKDGENANKYLINSLFRIVGNNYLYLNEELIDILFLYLSKDIDFNKHIIFSCFKNLSKFKLEKKELIFISRQRYMLAKLLAYQAVMFLLFPKEYIEIISVFLVNKVESYIERHKEVSIYRAAIPPVDEIKKIRGDAVDLLFSTYNLEMATNQEKEAVINALNSTTHIDPSVSYNEVQQKMILDDSMKILYIYKDLIKKDKDNYYIFELIEHCSYWRYCNSISDAIKNLCIEIKTLLDADDEYYVYKTLIGFRGVFTNWGETHDYLKTDNIRKEKILEYINSINQINNQAWVKRIVNYSSIVSDDRATFIYFNFFLEKLGKLKPEFSFFLLNQHAKGIANHMPHLLLGLIEDISNHENLKDIVNNWINNEEYLGQLSFCAKNTAFFTRDLTKALVEKLKINTECENNAIEILIDSLAERYAENKNLENINFFMQLQTINLKRKNSNWVHYFWARKNNELILQELNGVQVNIILENLLLYPEINYELEAILSPLAIKNPTQVLRYLFKRLAIYKENNQLPERYEPIPYDFSTMYKILADYPEELIKLLVESYAGFYEFIRNEAQLVALIFPNFSSSLETILFNLLETDNNSVEIIIAICRCYYGQSFLLNLLKKVVEKISLDSNMMNEVKIALLSTGVVQGMEGFLEVYENKKNEIKPWLSDSDEKVRIFAELYIGALEKEIEEEEKSVRERTQLMKYQYDK